MESLQSSEPSNQSPHQARKPLFVGLAVLLALSLVANVAQLVALLTYTPPPMAVETMKLQENETDVEERDQNIDATVLDMYLTDKFAWVVLYVGPIRTYDTDVYPGDFQNTIRLVRYTLDNPSSPFTYKGPFDSKTVATLHAGCAKSNWLESESGLLTFKYSNAPCGDAPYDVTEIVFDTETGEEVMLAAYGGYEITSIAFQKPGSPRYTLQPRTSGGCVETNEYYTDSSVAISTTTLLGIAIDSNAGTETFDLPSPKTVTCGSARQLGEPLFEPEINEINVSSNIVAGEISGAVEFEVSIDADTNELNVMFH